MGKHRSKPNAINEKNSGKAITNETQMPKCLMSPIKQSKTDIPLLPSFNTVLSPFTGLKPLYPSQNSPFVKIAPKQPLNEHLLDQSLPKTTHFQSTPNRPENKISNTRVNFHSIDDLATSSSSSINSSNSSTNDNTNNSSGYSSMIQPRVSDQSHENENKENEVKVEKKKNQRTSFSRKQKEILECAYKAKHYPDSNQIKYLCQQLDLKESVVRVCRLNILFYLLIIYLYLLAFLFKIWFQNKRARSKNQS